MTVRTPAQNIDLLKIIEAAEYVKSCSAGGDCLGAFAAADYIIRACHTEVPFSVGKEQLRRDGEHDRQDEAHHPLHRQQIGC